MKVLVKKSVVIGSVGYSAGQIAEATPEQVKWLCGHVDIIEERKEQKEEKAIYTEKKQKGELNA